MALDSKYFHKHAAVLRDARPWTMRFADAAKDPYSAVMAFTMGAVSMYTHPLTTGLSDLTFLFLALYFWWLIKQKTSLPYKLPKSARRKDPNYKRPDGSTGMADGILYLGNDSKTGEEIWFTNSDARTHCLYLGTTGSGKTFGLKSYACNALTWASGYIYIDGKADTSLWSTISAMARRFGRDDDLLIMNYMTGNATGRVPSNTLNPFSSGSASYLVNMLVSLMPDSQGDNAMWKERAVALVSSLMPCLVWKRENQNIPLSIGVIRTYLTFKAVIKLSRDPALPAEMKVPIKAYLDELPGYVDKVFDDNGDEKPAGPDSANVDTTVPRQQHGYLSMQFTRSMQSLGDDYGFIFDTQAADIDINDVVLNRRILIVLIPALEKSEDETANLGKIISSTLKGMMGATLGNTVEGSSATVIDNKPTNSATPFIAIFDEVGYYTAQGMAVMAAQARSLGFSLVFAGQDLPAMEKRVREEARSITANCNIKMFGKLEDPTQTKDFFEKTVGSATVVELSGYTRSAGGNDFQLSQQAGLQSRSKASYDELKGFTEGRAVCAFGKTVQEIQVYNSDIGDAKAMRVHRFLPIPPPAEEALDTLRFVDSVLRRLRNPKWNPAESEIAKNKDIDALAAGFKTGRSGKSGFVESGMTAVAAVAEAHGTINEQSALAEDAAPPAPPPVTAPQVSPVAEIAAAKTLASAGANPLSWGELIGGSEQEAPAVPRKDPPVTVAQAQAQAAPASSSDLPFFMIDPAKEQAAAQQVEAKLAPQGAGPMSWMNIIGGDTGAAAAAPAPAPMTPPPVSFVPLAPVPVVPAAAATPDLPPFMLPAASPAEAKAAEEVKDKGTSPMSWMDIIGGETDGGKK
jgi:intracellular multiplication protein IcmO